MSEDDQLPRIDLRIPAPWEKAEDFDKALAKVTQDYALEEEWFVHKPTGRRFMLSVSEPDDQIADVFEGGGRMSRQELERVREHNVKIHLSTPGGSVDAMRAIMQAAAAIVRAGGLGVMVDNSGAVHGRQDWLDLAGDKTSGGCYWACCAMTAGDDEVYSAGMHCLGLRDAEMPIPPGADREAAGFFLHNFLGYAMQSGIPILDGDPLGDETTSMFRARSYPCHRFPPGTPFFNPYGVWRLEPDIESDDDEGE